MNLSEQQDEERFERLINEHLSLFRGLSRRILLVAADVDDAVQSALLKAWRRRSTFRDEAKLAHWVARIVINESYDILRRRQREKHKFADFPAKEALASDEREEQFQRLDTAIAELPELYRQVVHIAILGGFDTDTAARMLCCSPNTLYQRIYKAKELLRRRLCHE